MKPPMSHIVLSCIMLLAAALGRGASDAPPAPLPKVFPAVVSVRAATGFEIVEGNLAAWDQDTLTIATKTGERQLQWNNLSANSAYALRARLIDHSKATAWLELGTYGWQIGAKDARGALTHAETMDPNLAERVAAVLKTEPGSIAATPVAAEPAPAATTRPQEPKYQKAAPEVGTALLEGHRKATAAVEEKLHLKFTELQTDHFQIFADWNEQENKFLQDNLERAYAAVTKQFDIPATEDVFLGKLPVFMLATRAEFLKFAGMIDQFPGAINADGYYSGNSRGLGHLVMYKPDRQGDIAAAKIRWGYILCHELTHAFVARYRNNRHVATWLNEGIAEVVASSLFPEPWALVQAKQTAASGKSIAVIFQGDNPKSAACYPVMRTVTEALLRRDRKAFLALFDEIKAGVPPETALKDTYKWDYATLEKAWRVYCGML